MFRRSLKALHFPPKFELIQAGICGCVGSPNTGFINHWFETFNRAKAYLKETESYVFKNPQMKPECWKLSTWCKKIARSSILKFGTPEDIAKLPEETHRNKPRRQPAKRNRPLCQNNRTTRRVQASPTEDPVDDPLDPEYLNQEAV